MHVCGYEVLVNILDDEKVWIEKLDEVAQLCTRREKRKNDQRGHW
jgi:hypothetical protein